MDSAPPIHELDMLESPASRIPLKDEELSEPQIYQLLKDAEQRLGSALIDPSKTSAVQNYPSISSLQKRYLQFSYCSANHIVRRLGVCSNLSSSLCTEPDNALPTSYIKMTSRGAQVDPGSLVTARQRKLANGARTVEDPVQSKSNLEKVNQTHEYRTNRNPFHEENISKHSLDAELWAVLVPPLLL